MATLQTINHLDSRRLFIRVIQRLVGAYGEFVVNLWKFNDNAKSGMILRNAGVILTPPFNRHA